ncbi:MAG TPA: CBS domain-containing protein [Burkholderiaceae bacterium]
MEREYQPLPILELGENAGFRRPVQAQPARVTRESRALEVMTDLTRASPATIRPQAPVEGANHYMLSRGVRLLLVVDESEAVLGVVTATDVLGERALRAALELGVPRGELKVSDIMTPARQIEVIALAEIEGARVGHVLKTFERAARQHMLVVDTDVLPAKSLLDKPLQRTMVRGVLSLSQLARQLGVPLPGGEVARTFSDIEAALSH